MVTRKKETHGNVREFGKFGGRARTREYKWCLFMNITVIDAHGVYRGIQHGPWSVNLYHGRGVKCLLVRV